MKNKTPYKTLRFVEDLESVTAVYQDSDGIWIEVAVGWTCEQHGAHAGHEYTATAAARTIRGIERCVSQCCTFIGPGAALPVRTVCIRCEWRTAETETQLCRYCRAEATPSGS